MKKTLDREVAKFTDYQSYQDSTEIVIHLTETDFDELVSQVKRRVLKEVAKINEIMTLKLSSTLEGEE